MMLLPRVRLSGTSSNVSPRHLETETYPHTAPTGGVAQYAHWLSTDALIVRGGCDSEKSLKIAEGMLKDSSTSTTVLTSLAQPFRRSGAMFSAVDREPLHTRDNLTYARNWMNTLPMVHRRWNSVFSTDGETAGT